MHPTKVSSVWIYERRGLVALVSLLVALVSLLVVSLVISVAGLWYQRDDMLARVTAGLVVALIAAGLAIVRESRNRAAADQLALKHEIEQHSRIFETTLDLILVTDRQGMFTRVSPSSSAILGYRPEEMIGHIGIDFIHPGDLESTRNEMRLARRGREMRNFETRYVHKDGRTVTLTWTGVWSEPEQRHFFIGRDMTVQKLLEVAERNAKETLAAVVDASPVAILCLAPDRKVLVWSRAAEQIFGYTAIETLGRPYGLVPPGQEPEYDDLFARALAGETLRDIRVKRRRKDGSLVDITFDAAPMVENGKVKAVAYALSDITERNKLELQLRQSQKMEAVGQLTAAWRTISTMF